MNSTSSTMWLLMKRWFPNYTLVFCEEQNNITVMCFSKRENNNSAISLSAPSKAPLSFLQKNNMIYTNKFPNGKMVTTFQCSCSILLRLKRLNSSTITAHNNGQAYSPYKWIKKKNDLILTCITPICLNSYRNTKLVDRTMKWRRI
jgi:hypothetical protein